MEGVRGRSRRGTVEREVWRVQDRSKRKNERERQAQVNKVNEEKREGIYDGLREDTGMKRYLHGPMDYVKKAEAAISCRGPGPIRKKKERYQ